MHKNNLSETDIRAKFITPALAAAGWSEEEQIYREYTLRPGRVAVRRRVAGRDSKSVPCADYVLFYKANIPLVVIEAKDNRRAVGAGMAQAIRYAELLNVPFCFASNGEVFMFRDATLATRIDGLAPYLALVCEAFKANLLAMVDRSTHGTCKLESRKLFGWAFDLPPLAEQHRIARVEKLRRLCAHLRERLAAAQRAQGQLADALVAKVG